MIRILDVIKKLIPILVPIVLWFYHPSELNEKAWHVFSILFFMISGFMVYSSKLGIIAFVGLTVSLVTGTLSNGEALSGYSNGLLWLIISAYFFAIAFIKTGLGRRIAVNVLSKAGNNPLAISYGMNVVGTVISAGIPSGTARASGIIYPIIKSICQLTNDRKTCQFLMQTYLQSECFICYLFVTAMAGNVLVIEFAKNICNIDITWGVWAMYAFGPGLVAFILVPLAMKWICNPLSHIEIPQDFYKIEAITSKEIKLLVIFIGAVLLWGFAENIGISNTCVAFIAVSLMILLNVIDWEDLIKEYNAWNTLVWMGALMGFAKIVSTNGLMEYFGAVISSGLSGYNWIVATFVICLGYHYSQYLFASTTAHLMATYGAGLSALLAVGCPPMISVLLLCLLANTATSVTQYSGGQCPMFYDSGYFTNKEFVDIGFKISWVHFFIVMLIGPLWWYALGLA